MNTMNVNGQNGVATSALKNAVVKAVKMINKAEYAKKGFVIIEEGHRLSFDGTRFIKEGKDNFIFNGKIEIKGGNGRYDQVIVEIHHKNLDNDGLCLNDMVNAVLDAILNFIDDVIVKCSSDVGHIIVKNNDDVDEDDISSFVSIYQVIRECYFGSKLVVNNTEDLNSPDALNIDEDYNLEFLRNRMPVIPIDLIKQGVDEYCNDEYEYRKYCSTGSFECDFKEFADNVWKNVWVLVLNNNLSDEALEFDTRDYMEFNDKLYYMIDVENINGLYLDEDNVYYY